MRRQTVGQLWPLLSGSTNAPTLTAGQQVSFQFQDVPDRVPGAPLAYYLPGVRLTFAGTVTQSGGTGTQLWSDTFFACLFSSLAWIQAWHGSPIQAQHVLGSDWNVIEYFANGHRYESNVRGLIAPAANGTYAFQVTIFVPFSSCRIGDLETDTSQLAVLARASQLQINAAAASVLTTLSTGASMSATVRASAILAPRQELVLGTPVEPILTQISSGAGNAIKITNFGTDTGLQGVDPGGGVLALLFMSSQNNQNSGSWSNGTLFTDFTFPWRGQAYTQDMNGLLQAWKRLLPDPGPSFNFTIGGNTTARDLFGVPYPLNNNLGYPPAAGAGNLELQNLLFWGLVMPGPEATLASLQTADSDQTFNMTYSAGYFGSHQLLGFYARSWQQRMLDNWLAQVMAGGNGSLAAYVLGPKYGSAKLGQRCPAGKHSLSHDERRYLPWQLVAA